MHHPSQSRLANFNINPALAYPSHSHSDPRYTHTRPILRNRAGPPLALVVSHRICNTRSRTKPNSQLAHSLWQVSGPSQTSSIPTEHIRAQFLSVGSRDYGL